MSWVELRLDTTDEAIDWVRTLLAEDHYTDDLRITQFICEEPTNQTAGDWAFTARFYLPNGTQARTQVEKLQSLLSPLHRTGQTTDLDVAVVEEKPIDLAPPIHRVGRFVILAPDTPYTAKADDILLRLKTSLSFGSGLHPATMLSLRLIERYVLPQMQVLDLGCGSGILSVAIAQLGAQVLALDNDRTAVQSTQDAVQRNGVSQVTVMEGSLGRGSQLGHWMGGTTLDQVPTIEPTARFDLIVANIFARVHIDLASDYQRSLRPSTHDAAHLIIAGFTSDYEAEVTHALAEAGFELLDRESLNEWLALAYRLKSDSSTTFA
jgi:ribosomal protein L11 methyltransferase